MPATGSALSSFCCTVKWQLRHKLSDLDAPNAHLLRDFVRLGVARHFAKGLEVMRALPGLDLLLVTFGTGIRTDGLGRIGRDSARPRQSRRSSAGRRE